MRDDAQGARARLRILALSDIHAHLNAYDYYRDRVNDTVGLVRTAGLIAEARAETRNCLLVDNGDFLQGTPLADFIAQERGVADAAHPVIAAMNALGVDAATLGNHEFDFGLDFLMASLAPARFPIVLSNVAIRLGRTPIDDVPLLPPCTHLDRRIEAEDGSVHDIRIGVLGVTPPQVMHWNRRALIDRVAARGVLDAARAWVTHLRADGADLVIALSHGGLGEPGGNPDDPLTENASAALAALDGVDAVVAGHVHRVFPGPDDPGLPGADPRTGLVHGTPVVMPGLWGSHLGVIDLSLENGPAGWRVAGSRVEARPIARREGEAVTQLAPLDARLARVVAPAHAQTLAYAARPVGETALPLNSHFSVIGWDSATAAVQQAQRRFVEGTLGGTPLDGLPLLSVGSAFKTGGRGGPGNYTAIAPGRIAIRDLADLYAFPNTVIGLRVTGAELRDWLDRAASVFRRIAPGAQGADLLDPACPAYLLDVIDGLDYAIDLSAPARFDAHGNLRDAEATRIRDLRHDGRPVDPDAVFALATNSYRAMGGGRFPGTGEARVVLDMRDAIPSLLVRYIADGGLLGLSPRLHFRFAPMPGTTVHFRSGSGAAAHLDAVPLQGLRALGPSEDGFSRFELPL